MSILQELLNLGLVDIGSDDSRFEKLEAASAAVAGKLKAEPNLFVPATLISLDESTDEDDEMFALVESLVIGEWKTLRNTHVNRPRELLRSIVINALAVAVSGNGLVGAILWNSAAPLLRHQLVRLGKAASVIETVLKGARDLAEKEAIVRLVATNAKVGSREKASPKRTPLNITTSINDKDVFADVARSAGPQHPQKPDLENPNPHWSSQQPAWSHEFATRMATALSKAVNLGSSRFSKALSEHLETHLDEFETQLTTQLFDVAREMAQTNDASRMRLDVLWWSEALYSPALQVGYRELPPPVAAFVAAVDLAAIVPPLTPASMCYVLGETVLRLSQLNDGNTGGTVHSYLESLAGAKVDFKDPLPVGPSTRMRLPLVALVGEAARGSRVSPDLVRQRAGVDPEFVLSPADFSMWMFRGIQANRLVEALR